MAQEPNKEYDEMAEQINGDRKELESSVNRQQIAQTSDNTSASKNQPTNNSGEANKTGGCDQDDKLQNQSDIMIGQKKQNVTSKLSNESNSLKEIKSLQYHSLNNQMRTLFLSSLKLRALAQGRRYYLSCDHEVQPDRVFQGQEWANYKSRHQKKKADLQQVKYLNKQHHNKTQKGIRTQQGADIGNFQGSLELQVKNSHKTTDWQVQTKSQLQKQKDQRNDSKDKESSVVKKVSLQELQNQIYSEDPQLIKSRQEDFSFIMI